jgi:hypothetical protein
MTARPLPIAIPIQTLSSSSTHISLLQQPQQEVSLFALSFFFFLVLVSPLLIIFLGSLSFLFSFVSVVVFCQVASVACGAFFTICVTVTGSVYTWGANDHG